MIIVIAVLHILIFFFMFYVEPTLTTFRRLLKACTKSGKLARVHVHNYII